MRHQLEKIQTHKLEGSLLRSKAQWTINGERPTKLFCNLENKISSKTINYIVRDDGTTVTTQSDILKETAKNYELIIESKDKTNNAYSFKCFIDSVSGPKLYEIESNNIEGKLTLEETLNALKTCKMIRVLAHLALELTSTRMFWCKIEPFVVRALNESFDKGHLSITQTQGIITCIPKGDKPRQFLKKWRPITLLNTVYKICSSCISNRIKPLLNNLIHSNQTGFIKDRYIGENTRLIYDIMHYTENNNIPVLLLLIDFERHLIHSHGILYKTVLSSLILDRT